MPRVDVIRLRVPLACGTLLILVSAGSSGIIRATGAAAATTTSTLSVVGNHLVDNGKMVVLRGGNRDGSEYACQQGWGVFDGAADDASIAAIASWGSNAVRVPFNEDCWLGINGINPAVSGANYRTVIIDFVTRLRAHGLYVILSDQVAGPGSTVSSTILPMPDADHAPAVWTSVASTFAGDKGVIFDLYNEPHDVSWSCWANGCLVTGGFNFVTPYQAAGMKGLTAAVRATGATNVIMIGGLGWSIDPSGWLANQPADGQLMVSIHNYDYSGWNTSAVWDNTYAPVAQKVPVTIGEVGFDGYIEQVMPWADAHGIGYLAWTWDAWPNNNEALISDYNGTPTAYGTGFKNYLAGLTPPNTPTVMSVAPTSGPAAGGTPVTITGTNLTGATAVKFGTAPATTFVATSATQITATSPPGSGTVDVTVTTAGATSAVSAADKFAYTSPATAYTSQSPNRILDTRTSGQTLTGGVSLNLTVAGGTTGVPATATGVVLNVTVTNTTAPSFLTAWPAGANRANASNLNWMAGETRANLVNVSVGAGGQVSIYNGAGSADVVVDEEGYFAAPVGMAGGYNSLSPSRLLDTRTSGQTMSNGSLIDIPVLGASGVPASGVSAVVLNVTATNTATAGYFTVFPSLTSRPNASNVNWSGGWTVANRVIVKVGTNGKVSIYNGQGSADAVIDVGGYFTDSSTSGKFFTQVSPVRVLDTRVSGGTIGPNGTYLNFKVTGNNSVPSGATAVFLNATVTNTTAPSFLTAYPNGRPTASDLNWVAGQTIPNSILATLSSTGATSFYNSAGSTDLVLDLSGWFS
jgi:Cellulase (glycosyl hydrolase family 5)/IPT/TIG domain